MDDEQRVYEEIENIVKGIFEPVKRIGGIYGQTRSFRSKNFRLELHINKKNNYIFVKMLKVISRSIVGGVKLEVNYEKEYLFDEKNEALRELEKNIRVISLKEAFIN